MNELNNVTTQGYILNKHAFDRKGALVLRYWLTYEGKSTCVDVTGEKAVFFIQENCSGKAEALIRSSSETFAEVKHVNLQSFNFDKMSAVYCGSLAEYYTTRDLFKSDQIKCYEDDIRPEDRYLMERFITSAMIVSGEFSARLSNHLFSYFIANKAKPIDYKPVIKILSLDIECDMDGSLFSIAGYSDTHEKVIMIGEPQHNSEEYIEWVADEEMLLYTLNDWLIEFDPDIIIGWNVINFDFALLKKRYELHNIPFNISRDRKVPRWRTNRNQTDQQFITINGRVVIDGIDLLKTATYNFPSFSLENVAQVLLGKGKSVDSAENRVAEIQHNFKYNKTALARYNLMDCQLVWEIFEKTSLLDFAILRSQLTGLSIDRVGGSVAAFTNLYLPRLHRAGYIAPNLGDGISELQSPGGYVMDSIPGLYKNVLVLDFKSLYPSIIKTFNVDPMGLIEGLKEPESSIEGFDGAYFSRDKHFLPEIIEQLWCERDHAKKAKDAALSQAIKIIMNSFYGVLGSTGCRFYDPRLSGSITKRSHQILKQTKAWLEQKGIKTIYGDTDSIFVLANEEASKDECIQLGNRLMNDINEYWRRYIADNFQLESQLDIEFETHFSQFFMPTIRGQDVGTKKRYAGLIIDKGKESLVFKGLEAVRTDWTALAKEFQLELYERIFHDRPVESFVKQCVLDTRQGLNDSKLVYRKRLRRKLDNYVKNVPPHVKAARHADEKNKKAGKPLKYQNKGWIEYVMTVNGPEAIEYLSSNIDYDLYVERQIQAVAEAILPFVGVSFNEIVNDQMSLF